MNLVWAVHPSLIRRRRPETQGRAALVTARPGSASRCPRGAGYRASGVLYLASPQMTPTASPMRMIDQTG